jgi:hypothetical protein
LGATADKFSIPMLLSRQERTSAAKRNTYGEMGSPCIIPLDALKILEPSPLTKTKKYTAVTNLIIK